MKKILIYGHKSFTAKNFINDYNKKYNLFFFNKRFKKKTQKTFILNLKKFITKNKIKYLINFAADNDNSLNIKNFDKILESNFYLPVALVKLCESLKITLVLFLSEDMSNSNYMKNFYSISKNMLNVYLKNLVINFKLRIFNLNSLYGPYDLNYKRIIPSVFFNQYKKNKKKIKVNLSQKKNFSFVKEMNKDVSKSLDIKKKLFIKTIKSEIYDISILSNLIKSNKKLSTIKLNKKYLNFLFTARWYKNYYAKK